MSLARLLVRHGDKKASQVRSALYGCLQRFHTLTCGFHGIHLVPVCARACVCVKEKEQVRTTLLHNFCCVAKLHISSLTAPSDRFIVLTSVLT